MAYNNVSTNIGFFIRFGPIRVFPILRRTTFTCENSSRPSGPAQEQMDTMAFEMKIPRNLNFAAFYPPYRTHAEFELKFFQFLNSNSNLLNLVIFRISVDLLILLIKKFKVD